MINHIYGRCQSLVPEERPHMFAKEIVLYVDYFKDLVEQGKEKLSKLKKFKNNLENGMDYCLEIVQSEAYRDENLSSIPPTVKEQRERLTAIFNSYRKELSEATVS